MDYNQNYRDKYKNQFREIRYLSKGSYGQVHLVKELSNNNEKEEGNNDKLYVAKKINLD